MISLGDALLKLSVDAADLKKGMADASNSVKQSLNDMGAKIRETEKANEESTKNIAAAWQSIQGQLRVVGVAFTAVGVAGLKMVSDARQMNADLAQTAITVGTTTREMRDLALSITDVTFPLNSVIKTLDLLARSGIKDTGIMQKTAKAFDALGEATGNPAEVMAELLLPAFKLFGKEIPTTTNELDKFTWLVKNSTVDLSDFGTLLTRMAPYMDELGLSMEDAIVMLKALSEHGIQGTAATLKLRTAITQAAETGEDLTDILGLTNDELKKYRDEMDDAVGITDDYADAAKEQYGIMDKLKQKWSELTLKMGSFLTPLEPILGTMSSIGIIMIALSVTNIPKLIVSIGALSKAMWAFVLSPAGAIITAIAAIVIGVVLLITHWKQVVDFFKGPATVAMEQLQGKIKDLGNEILTTIDKAKTSSLKQWADDQKAAIGDVIKAIQDASQAKDLAGLKLFSEETLASIRAINPALADQLEIIQKGIGDIQGQYEILDKDLRQKRIVEIETQLRGVGLTKTEIADLQKELQKQLIKPTPIRSEERIIEIQALLVGAESTEKEQVDLLDELAGLYRQAWQDIVKENESTIVTALQNMQTDLDTALQTQLTSWQTHWADINTGNDGTVAYLRDVILPAMNQALIDGFITKEVVDEWKKRYNDALTEFEKTAPKKPWWKNPFFIPSWEPRAGNAAANATGNATVSRQFGGTIPGPIGQPIPIMAHGGEEYLGVQNIGRSMGNNITINLGLLPGDDVTIRRVARAIKDVLGEDGRRNTFAQVNQGYFYGKSAI